MPAPRTPLSICLVGVGTHTLAVLERLCAQARRTAAAERVHVHVVDEGGAERTLREQFARVCLAAPGQVEIITHYCRAVAVHGKDDGGSRQSVLLENGRVIEDLDAVVHSPADQPAKHRPSTRIRASSAPA
ncbi:hypothetical protein ACHBTE_03190 [Streptomyces sp. M41]|uniref:hypothetical protein n=1 Tax=Streptomyces sp. M41 TaxID=3059412 RepID=UPI00374DED97